MNIIQRASAETPKFFRILRNIGLGLAAAGAAVLASPIALPAIAVTIAGYATVAGSVIGAISQITIKDDSE